ncbi:30S ribosomal protein S17 [Candidatus Microgenomates bacterium]|nr:30S ribosomal protein S17 [Candidatus Microgenomates bacterium]
MKKVQGVVISNKMEKAATVKVSRWVTHPLYGKRLRRQKNYHAQNLIDAKIGNKVILVQTRPISRTISWKIMEVIK